MALMTNKKAMAFMAATLIAVSAGAAPTATAPTAVKPAVVTANIQALVAGLDNAMLPPSLDARTIEKALTSIPDANSKQFSKTLGEIVKMQKDGKVDKGVLTNYTIAMTGAATAPAINTEIKDGKVMLSPSADQKKEIVNKVRKEAKGSDLLGLTDDQIVNIVLAQVTLMTGDGTKMLGKGVPGFEAFLAENKAQIAAGVNSVVAFLKAAEKTQGGRVEALKLIEAIIRDCARMMS